MITFNKITLRPEYQEPAHLETIKNLDSYRGPFCLDVSVGGGKTVLIGAIAKHYTDQGLKVLVLARQGELIDQDSKEAWGMGCRNSIFSASLKSKSTVFNCVMGTEQTVSNHLKFEFKAGAWNPDIILIDECHQVDFEDLEKWKREYLKGNQLELEKSYSKIITHFAKINKKLKIVGYTGSPYRGRTDIIGNFWRKTVYKVSTMELTALGYLVPPIFGFPDLDHSYDLSEFKIEGGEGAHDFTAKELAAMQRKINKDKTKTEIIIEEVIQKTKNRNGVLITCAGKKHCEQVAEFLPDDSYAIITDSTGSAKRSEYLEKAKNGEIKFVLQIGCLTTGIDVSYWDTNVLLRKIGSLTLLTQLLGRTARLLKPHLSEKGIIKDDHLILDYAGVFESMGSVYDDPILNKALIQFAEDKNRPQKCPECDKLNDNQSVVCECGFKFKQECEKCGFLNSQYAQRCINEDKESEDGRCDHFFNSQLCLVCNTENSKTAQSCRKCDAILIDPNRNLVNKAYSDDDFKKVIKVEFEKSKSGQGIWVSYYLDAMIFDRGIQEQEIAKEYIEPFSKEQHKKSVFQKFVRNHIPCARFRSAFFKQRTVSEILKNKAQLSIPSHITHRVNEKGFSIISRKKFLNGRIEK